MESSLAVGATSAEKWSSGSESGWTMYIGSSIQSDNNKGHVYYSVVDKHKEGNDKHNDKKAILDYEDDEEESDDSMASDASSGPSHHELLLQCGINSEGSCAGGRHLRHAAAKEEQIKKTCMKEKKRDERRIKAWKDQELLYKADSVGSHV